MTDQREGFNIGITVYYRGDSDLLEKLASGGAMVNAPNKYFTCVTISSRNTDDFRRILDLLKNGNEDGRFHFKINNFDVIPDQIVVGDLGDGFELSVEDLLLALADHEPKIVSRTSGMSPYVYVRINKGCDSLPGLIDIYYRLLDAGYKVEFDYIQKFCI